MSYDSMMEFNVAENKGHIKLATLALLLPTKIAVHFYSMPFEIQPPHSRQAVFTFEIRADTKTSDQMQGISIMVSTKSRMSPKCSLTWLRTA